MSGQFREIDAKAVQDFLDVGKGVLVDTLPPEHYELKHIPGARNACVYEVVFLQTMEEIVPDKSTPVVVYGAGPDSRDCLEAADKLGRVGYEHVSVFRSGREGWASAGLKFEGSDPDAFDPPHPVSELEKRVYTLVPEDSIIHWIGRNNNGSHDGTLCVANGELEVNDGMTGRFSINMKSIRNRDLKDDPLQPVLEAHLASDDFFFVERFPQADFIIDGARTLGDSFHTSPNYSITGTLTLKGVKRELNFPAHVRNLEGGRIVLLANFDLDRTEWGVFYGSARFFQYLGYHVVYDVVSVDLRIVMS